MNYPPLPTCNYGWDILDTDAEYNLRQYQMIDGQIREFQEGRIRLPTLIANLKGLNAALKSPDPSWQERFMSEWGVLEVAYASVLYRKEKGQLQDVEAALAETSLRERLNRAILNIRALVKTADIVQSSDEDSVTFSGNTPAGIVWIEQQNPGGRGDITFSVTSEEERQIVLQFKKETEDQKLTIGSL